MKRRLLGSSTSILQVMADQVETSCGPLTRVRYRIQFESPRDIRTTGRNVSSLCSTIQGTVSKIELKELNILLRGFKFSLRILLVLIVDFQTQSQAL